jgi:hypothetical protein
MDAVMLPPVLFTKLMLLILVGMLTVNPRIEPDIVPSITGIVSF